MLKFIIYAQKQLKGEIWEIKQKAKAKIKLSKHDSQQKNKA